MITAKLWCRDADILYHGEQTKAYRVLSGIDADVYEFLQYITDRVAPASTNVIDAVNQTKMGSLLKLYATRDSL